MPILLSKSKNRAKNECRSLAFNADVYVLHRVHEMDTFLGKKADAKKTDGFQVVLRKTATFRSFWRQSGSQATFSFNSLNRDYITAEVAQMYPRVVFCFLPPFLIVCSSVTLRAFKFEICYAKGKYLGQCKVGLCDKQFQGFFKGVKWMGFVVFFCILNKARTKI